MAPRVQLRNNILTYTITDSGYRQYDVRPLKVSETEFKRLVKRANDRLYKLEKSGLSVKSREYREVSHYANSDPTGKGSIYNVNFSNDTIRFTSSLRGLSSKERSYLVNTVRNFLNSETSTISGTKRAIKRAYESFKNNNKALSNITMEQYDKLWQTYRDMTSKDQANAKLYNVFVELYTSTNLYELSADQIKTALSYMENSSATSTTGIVSDILDSVAMEDNGFKLEKR